MIVKPLSVETDLSTETTVQDASVVRLVNTGSETLVTIKNGASTVASFTLTSGEVLHVQKSPSHKLLATGDVLAVKIAHTN